jgi:hypothetical protein
MSGNMVMKGKVIFWNTMECIACECRLDAKTVRYCGGECGTWYCQDCLEEREYEWCDTDICCNYNGSECKNCGHELSVEELAEGKECCEKPDHTPE